MDSSSPFPFPRVTCCNFCPSFEETEHPLPHPRFSSCKELNLFLFLLSSMLPYTCHFACVFLIVWISKQIRVFEHLQWSLCHIHSLLLPYSVRFKVKQLKFRKHLPLTAILKDTFLYLLVACLQHIFNSRVHRQISTTCSGCHRQYVTRDEWKDGFPPIDILIIFASKADSNNKKFTCQPTSKICKGCASLSLICDNSAFRECIRPNNFSLTTLVWRQIRVLIILSNNAWVFMCLSPVLL